LINNPHPPLHGTLSRKREREIDLREFFNEREFICPQRLTKVKGWLKSIGQISGTGSQRLNRNLQKLSINNPHPPLHGTLSRKREREIDLREFFNEREFICPQRLTKVKGWLKSIGQISGTGSQK
jgi:hypothetical protein